MIDVYRLSGGWGKNRKIKGKRSLKNEEESNQSFEKRLGLNSKKHEDKNCVSGNMLAEIKKNGIKEEIFLRKSTGTPKILETKNKQEIKSSVGKNVIKNIIMIDEDTEYKIEKKNENDKAEELIFPSSNIVQRDPSIKIQSKKEKFLISKQIKFRPKETSSVEKLILKESEIRNTFELEKNGPCNTNQDMLNLTLVDNEICAKIENLEKQLEEIYSELKNMREEFLPPADLRKLQLFSDQFKELNELLLELKVNCSILQNTYGASLFFEQIQQSLTDLRLYDYQKVNPTKIYEANAVYDKNNMPKILESERANNRPIYCCKYRHNFSYNALRKKAALTTCQVYNEKSFVFPKSALEYEHGWNLYHNKCSPDNNSADKNLKEISGNANENRNRLFDNSTPNIQNLISEEKTSPIREYFLSNQLLDNRRQLSKLDFEPLPSKLSDTNLKCEGYLKSDSKKSVFVEFAVTTSDLCEAIWRVIGSCKCENIALTVSLESNHLYHINISTIRSGISLGCFYTTEAALNDAKRKHFFDKFLTFFVLNPKNTFEEREQILGHSYEFAKSSK